MAVAAALTRRFVPADLDPSTWENVEPLFESLLSRDLSTAAQAEAWLTDYSELMCVVSEYGSRANIDKACDTESDAVDRAFLNWVEAIEPKLKPVRDALERKLLDSGLADQLPADRFGVMVRDWRTAVDLFRADNVALQTQLTKLAADYDKNMGALTVDYRGKTYNLPQLAKFQEDPDRATREEAWRLDAAQRLTVRDANDTIFTQQVAVRDQIAKNAGLASYTDWVWRDKGRHDYSEQDCADFCDAIAELCVPMERALNEKRRQVMGLDTLRPWDSGNDALGRPPLSPFPADDATPLVRGCHAIFASIDTGLAEDFGQLKMGRNLDLVSRKGKRGGGFQASLAEQREPFIFMNTAGRQIDVRVLLHEAGHAFHYQWASLAQDNYFTQRSPIEFAEVASMSMELFGLDKLGRFYPGDDEASRRAQLSMLEGIVRFFPWMAVIDRFQHWVYANPSHSSEQRTDAWRSITHTFGTRHGGAGTDWTGLDDELDSYWQRQIHLFHYPFYYVEYGIAQLGALQLWQQYRSDPGQALANYRKALALGGSRTLPELFAAADIRFDFSKATLAPLMQDVDNAIQALQ
ncbi:MAG: M3 family oligoendopeptidase [Phycisphaerales bacterium JB063]